MLATQTLTMPAACDTVDSLSRLTLPGVSRSAGAMSLSPLTFPPAAFASFSPVPLAQVSLPFVQFTQEGNTCGSTSLKIAMYPLGVRPTDQQVACATGCSPYFGTSPLRIRDAAREYGLHAEMVNHLSHKELRRILDHGGYPIVLLKVCAELHYTVITGYKRFQNCVTYSISDPNGFQTQLSSESLTQRWSDITFKGVHSGLSQFAVVVSKDPVVKDNLQLNDRMLPYFHAVVCEVTNFITPLFDTLLKAVSIFSFVSLRWGEPKGTRPYNERSYSTDQKLG